MQASIDTILHKYNHDISLAVDNNDYDSVYRMLISERDILLSQPVRTILRCLDNKEINIARHIIRTIPIDIASVHYLISRHTGRGIDGELQMKMNEYMDDTTTGDDDHTYEIFLCNIL